MRGRFEQRTERSVCSLPNSLLFLDRPLPHLYAELSPFSGRACRSLKTSALRRAATEIEGVRADVRRNLGFGMSAESLCRVQVRRYP